MSELLDLRNEETRKKYRFTLSFADLLMESYYLVYYDEKTNSLDFCFGNEVKYNIPLTGTTNVELLDYYELIINELYEQFQ